MTKKVLFLINSLAGGGAERVMTTLLAHSEGRRDEYDFSLALLDRDPAAYAPPPWLKVHQLDSGGRLGASITAVRELIRRERPDVTLSFLTRANIANIVATGGARAIISERVHTSAHLGNHAAGRLAKLFVRLAYRRAARVIAVSKGVGDHLVDSFGVRAGRVSVIHNPFDLDKIRRAAEQAPPTAVAAPSIVAMGRLVETKNFELLIDAYAASGADQHLVIAGEGPRRPELEAQIARHGLADRISLPGFVANPYGLLRQADFFVLPSNAEGFPNGLVEAMAVGLPVIATDCQSGPREILADGAAATGEPVEYAAHGVLVPMGDVAAMAQALTAMSKAETRAPYAARAARRALDFDVRHAVASYWAIIDETLASRDA